MTGFTASSIVREAIANAAAHRLGAVLLALFALATPSTGVTLSSLHVTGIEERQAELRERGSGVFIVAAEDRRALPAARCDALATVPGVSAAGAVIGGSHMLTPTATADVLAATPGWPLVVWPSLDAGHGMLAGAVIANEQGLVAGAILAPGITVDAVAPPSLRVERADLGLVEVVPPTGTVTECLVEAEPGAERAVEALLLGWFRSSPAIVQPMFAAHQAGRTPQQELDGRVTLWAAPAGAALVGGALIVAWLARRAEFAIYAAAGIRRGGLLLMLAVEWSVLMLVPAAAGLAIGVGLLDPQPGSLAAAMLSIDVVRALGVALLVPVAGWFALARISAFDALKGR